MGLVIKLNNVRLSFPKLGEPEYYQGVKQREGDQKRWSASFHIGPESTAQFVVDKKLAGAPVSAKGFIDAALKKAAEDQWKDKAKGYLANILPDPKGCCWTDGARKDMDGIWIMASHRKESDGRPLVLDADMTPIYDKAGQVYSDKAGRVYSGMYVNAQIELWAQDNKAGRGLRSTLMIVQRFKDGDAFSGATAPVVEAFGEVADGSDAEDLS